LCNCSSSSFSIKMYFLPPRKLFTQTLKFPWIMQFSTSFVEDFQNVWLAGIKTFQFNLSEMFSHLLFHLLRSDDC
jgi:hypothetical protein